MKRNIPDHFFLELRNIFLGLKILKFFDVDPDPGPGIWIFITLDPGSGIEKFGPEIRHNHPGPETLIENK